MLQKLNLFKKLIQEHITLTPETKKSWKYFFRWYKTTITNKDSLNYGLPWFNFQAIEFIKNNLSENAKIFEFGGGGSTSFFINNNCYVYTVEHNEEWFYNIEKFITSNNKLKSWEGFFIQPEDSTIVDSPEIDNPTHYFSNDKDYKAMNFKAYASKIDDFNDCFFDVVLVDGRVRPSCVYHAISKIKNGGFLVVDNTERDYYTSYFNKHYAQDFSLILDVYGPVPFTNWFHKTSIWKKNK